MTIKKTKKTYTQLETELKIVKSRCLWDSLSKLIQPLIKWSALVFIFYFCYLSIYELSGKNTDALINIKAEASFNPTSDDSNKEPEQCIDANNKWAYWIAIISAILATSAIGYGLSQKQLRKLTVKQLAPYQEKWEQLVDKNRTSSGLLPDGSTNPCDE